MPSFGQLAKTVGTGVVYYFGQNATEDPRAPGHDQLVQDSNTNSSLSLPGEGPQFLRGAILANPDQFLSPLPEDDPFGPWSSVVPTTASGSDTKSFGEPKESSSEQQVISDARPTFPHAGDLPTPPVPLPKSGDLHALMTATAAYALGQATFGSSIGAALTQDPTVGLNPICDDVPDWSLWFGERLANMGLLNNITNKVTVPNDARATAGLPLDETKFQQCLEYCAPQRAHLVGPPTSCEYGCGMAAVCRPKQLPNKVLPVLCADQDGGGAILGATLDTSRGMQAWFFWTMSSSVFAFSGSAVVGTIGGWDWGSGAAPWWHGLQTLLTVIAPTIFSEGWLKGHLGQAHGVGTTRPYGTHMCEEWAGFKWLKAGLPSGHTVTAYMYLAYWLGSWTPAIRSVFGRVEDINRVRTWTHAGDVTDQQLANVLALGRFFLFFASECVVPGNWQVGNLWEMWEEVSGWLGVFRPNGTCYTGLNHLNKAKRMLFLYKNLQAGSLDKVRSEGVWTRDAVVKALMDSYDVSVRQVIGPKAGPVHPNRVIPRHVPVGLPAGALGVAWEDATHGLGPHGFGVLPQVTEAGRHNFANFPVRALGERQGWGVAGGVSRHEDGQNRDIFNRTFTTFLNLVQKDASWLEASVNGIRRNFGAGGPDRYEINAATSNKDAIQTAIQTGAPLLDVGTGLPAAEAASGHVPGLWDDRVRNTAMWVMRLSAWSGPLVMAFMPAWRHGALDHTGKQTDLGIAEAALWAAGLQGLWYASTKLVPALRP